VNDQEAANDQPDRVIYVEGAMHCWIPRWSLRLSLLALLASARLLNAGQVVQHFPANEPEANMRTKWRIVWGIERQNGRAQVLYVKEAYFTRAKGESEVKILGDSRLAEIFVPYNNGETIWDLIEYDWELSVLEEKALGPGCVTRGRIYDASGNPAAKGPVAVEIHDDNVRWFDNSANTNPGQLDKSRRGQALLLWSVIKASNYRYIILYVFRDDGEVGFRLGATARNLFPGRGTNEDNLHVHTGCWRLNLALDDQGSLAVDKVELATSSAGNAGARKLLVTPLAKEEKILWRPERFTRLNVRSTKFQNQHKPNSSYIGYDVIPTTSGSPRYYGQNEGFTLADFWVLRDRPADLQTKCQDLPSYLKGEPLAGGRPVLWYQTGVLHRIRDEDFGKDNDSPANGVAITGWGGFDLVPRNFFSSTPLYP
jgi:Cu2+-containing amine oxidase